MTQVIILMILAVVLPVVLLVAFRWLVGQRAQELLRRHVFAIHGTLAGIYLLLGVASLASDARSPWFGLLYLAIGLVWALVGWLMARHFREGAPA